MLCITHIRNSHACGYKPHTGSATPAVGPVQMRVSSPSLPPFSPATNSIRMTSCNHVWYLSLAVLAQKFFAIVRVWGDSLRTWAGHGRCCSQCVGLILKPRPNIVHLLLVAGIQGRTFDVYPHLSVILALLLLLVEVPHGSLQSQHVSAAVPHPAIRKVTWRAL